MKLMKNVGIYDPHTYVYIFITAIPQQVSVVSNMSKPCRYWYAWFNIRLFWSFCVCVI